MKPRTKQPAAQRKEARRRLREYRAQLERLRKLPDEIKRGSES